MQIDLFSNQVKDFVTNMEQVKNEIRAKVGSHTAFTTPPGFRQWPRNLQQFVYAVNWETIHKGIDFAICGANIRVDRTTLRPCELS